MPKRRLDNLDGGGTRTSKKRKVDKEKDKVQFYVCLFNVGDVQSF